MEHRVTVFDQIHEIVFHGKGGFDYNTVYNMPIWLRRYTFKKIQEFYDKEAEESKKASQGQIEKKSSQVKVPDFAVKARK